ncbi:MAG: tRNA pseudouridine(55) synthase TruB, partial [Oscillospiraceae bacterium]
MQNNDLKELNGVLCVKKPSGFTSFDVIAKLRGILKYKKIGHGGTLDPMATGVLPLFLGKAKKAIEFVCCHDKEYTAKIKFGIKTDTLDITGNVIETKLPSFSLVDLTKALEMFRGNILQITPMFSAVKINGKRLYSLARSG